MNKNNDQLSEICSDDNSINAPDISHEDGSVIIDRDGIVLQCLTVIGQIEGHYLLSQNQKSTKYEHIIPQLVSVEESKKIDGLLIILNTIGGDVEAGLAIAELIASMSKPTVSIVLGGGHSIGVPLAVSAKKSFIVPSATMTVHPVRISGIMLGAPQTYDYMNRMQNRIMRFISEHSSITPDRLKTLMLRPDEMATDLGTILEGSNAVNEGLIDEVGGLATAISALRSMVKAERNKNQTADKDMKE